MNLLNYEKLFEPYTRDGHTLENTMKYLNKLAANRGISEADVEMAISEVFDEMAGGRVFSKTKCHCGCGIDKAATDLIHTIRDRVLEKKGNRIGTVVELSKESNIRIRVLLNLIGSELRNIKDRIEEVKEGTEKVKVDLDSKFNELKTETTFTNEVVSDSSMVVDRIYKTTKEYKKANRLPLVERSKIVGSLQKIWWLFCPEDKVGS